MTIEDDNNWAVEAAAGDAEAFARLVRRHSPAIKQMVRGMGLPETDVDDVVQETFLAAWRSLSEYDPTRSVLPWLMRIGINKVRDTQRFRRVRHFLFRAKPLDDEEGRALHSEQAGPEQVAGSQLELAKVRRVLNSIDPSLREALVLTAFVGLSQVEAASALGISLKTIEGRVLRARAKLTDVLSRGK
ncbi:sigma-70 family RNA polymerase sigma factor [Stenotrophomonas sp. MH181796]|uniref:RNA polymerase sigma factor n=1 Tax=Stenotrophomonas sp. MH181796 TaxID=2339228 RepID=UPI001EB9DF9F|nr:sigma-70 family RNA polymerase sigma factor [Stenotrophomonas sp. MH181796]MRI44826.1 sigma-70 family RNA polymerase sigma factor [Stenotrophomonas sp. MH181796]